MPRPPSTTCLRAPGAPAGQCKGHVWDGLDVHTGAHNHVSTLFVWCGYRCVQPVPSPPPHPSLGNTSSLLSPDPAYLSLETRLTCVASACVQSWLLQPDQERHRPSLVLLSSSRVRVCPFTSVLPGARNRPDHDVHGNDNSCQSVGVVAVAAVCAGVTPSQSPRVPVINPISRVQETGSQRLSDGSRDTRNQAPALFAPYRAPFGAVSYIFLNLFKDLFRGV